MSEVNKTAAAFLKALKDGAGYKEERIDTVSISAPIEALKRKLEKREFVALKRTDKPLFFAGFKKSGDPVFTHELKLAKSFEIKCLTMVLHIGMLETIGINVVPHDTIWHEGRIVCE